VNQSDIDIWETCLDNEYQAYLDSNNGKGVFSIEGDEGAEAVGKLLSTHYYHNGIVLDVGCGMLPKPSYMKNGVYFIGIDPFEGYTKRDFLFVQGVGEHLPFPKNMFDAVLFNSSLDHVIDREQCLWEAYRVLKPEGNLIVLYCDRKDGHYLHPYNNLHPWPVYEKYLRDTCKDVGFWLGEEGKEDLIVGTEKIFMGMKIC